MSRGYYKPWTAEEIEFIRVNYLRLGPRGCEKKMNGRNHDSIRHQARKMGLSAIYPDEKSYFESRFRVTPGCWIWLFGKDQDGYGQVKFEGKNTRASRCAYVLYKGRIPAGMFVCHTCDNPSCVNPGHLFVGTAGDNNIDKTKKGRGAKGERMANAKATDAIVRSIRTDTRPVKEIAKEYSMSETSVYYIINRKTWKHVE